MRRSESTVFVFIASIIVGILIAMNIKIDSSSKILQLTAKEYQNAQEKKNKLLKDISNLKENNSEIADKMNEYKINDSENGKLAETMKSEAEKYKAISGYLKVTGPGLVIKVADGSSEMPEPEDEYIRNFIMMRRIVHDNDMFNVIMELRMAGAQAISINGVRVTGTSNIICNWAFLGIGSTKVAGPFYVSVLGNKEKMKEILLQEGSYLKKLMAREIEVKITEKDNLIIPKADGNLETQYITPYESK